jgi:hypothetical protein
MKVSYLKHWKDGTLYNQTITIDKVTGVKFNNYVETLWKQDKEKLNKTHVQDNAMAQRDMYLKRLALGVNYTYLTTLDYFVSFLLRETNESIKRIKRRNTIIIVK